MGKWRRVLLRSMDDARRLHWITVSSDAEQSSAKFLDIKRVEIDDCQMYIMGMLKTCTIETHNRSEMRIIDAEIQQAIAESGVREGTALIWVPHTTAGVTINENADPDVVRDMLLELEKIVPAHDGYRHAEGNSDAHIKSTLFSPSLTLIVSEGRPLLGTWQSAYFCEFDGPRRRRFHVKVTEG